MTNAIIAISAFLTAIATGCIAFYAVQSYLLSSAIKKASEEQQRNINKFTMALIAASLFIAKYSHTSQKDVKIQDFDYKLKEVENYFKKPASQQ